MKSKVKSQISRLHESSVMEELLARHKLRGFQRGDRVQATVISISGRQVFLDLGGKSEGVVEGREYEGARDFIKSLKVGGKIEVTIVIPETRSGLTLVSLRGVASDTSWKKLEDALNSDGNVFVVVRLIVRGGLQVDFQGLSGFIPTSQLGTEAASHLENLLGKQIEVRPLEVDPPRGRVIFSEREVSESDQIGKQKEAMSGIKVGEEYEGEVAKVAPFGVFVRITKNDVPVEGLLHSSRIANIEELKEGKKVTVRVSNSSLGRLAFDLGARELDISKYAKDLKVGGRVLKVDARRATIELEKGITGTLNLSAVPAGETVRAGETHDFFVESIDSKKGRITLGLVLKAKPVGYK